MKMHVCMLIAASFAAHFLRAESGSVLVFEATGGGFAAAIAAARSGANVTLLAASGSGGGTGSHIGGMVTGGLQHTDCGNASVIGGIALEFFTSVELRYPNRSTSPNLTPITGPNCWLFEAHVAEEVMQDMLRAANVSVIMGVQGISSVSMSTPTRVSTVTTLDGSTHTADVFIDASYEGDLLMMAGATMVYGRESAAMYNESGGGVRPFISYDQFGSHIDPYWPGTNLTLPLIYTGETGEVGQGDAKVEAYTYRLCMTRSPSHAVPITSPPPAYNSSTFELFRRVLATGNRHRDGPMKLSLSSVLACLGPIPNNYTDCPPGSNTNSTTTANATESGGLWCKCDMIGAGALNSDLAQGSWAYPHATVQQRREIALQHAYYTWGLLWFLATDPAVPPTMQAEMKEYGLCSDEFVDTVPQYFPHQLYVREARRLLGDFVLTQNTPKEAFLNRSIGLGSYAYDAHVVQRVVALDAATGKAWVANEGEIVPQPPAYQPPYRIPYDVLLPQRQQLTNVLAAVPVSASHVVYTSLRMEPTWMIMGHAAGVAAAMAAASAQPRPVQDVDVTLLQRVLELQGQIIRP